MTRELDTVFLLKDQPNEGLVKGDVGSVVFIHAGEKAFEVEFITVTGDTLRVLNCELTPYIKLVSGNLWKCLIIKARANEIQ